MLPDWVNELSQKLWAAMETNIERDGDLAPVIFAFNAETREVKLLAVPGGETSSDDIYELAKSFKSITSADFIAVATEVWLAAASKEEAEGGAFTPPSQRADREEAVMLSVTGRMGAVMYVRKFIKKDE